MADFAERLKDYKEAIAEEFAKDVTDPTTVREITTKLFVEEMPIFAKQLRYIAQHAEKESDQLAAIKFAFEFIFGKGTKDVDPNSMDALIKQLMEND